MKARRRYGRKTLDVNGIEIESETRGATSSARISQILAADIISGVLVPGEKLEEKILSERFGVSRTPVREAIRDLAAKKLVEPVARGVIVARIGIAELSDMLEAECELEALCARVASQKMSALEREHLRILFEEGKSQLGKGDLTGYLEMNERFHAVILDGIHNTSLATTVRSLRERLAPFRRAQPGPAEDRLRQSLDEHKAILDAVVQGDSEAAYCASRAHGARLNTGALLQINDRTLFATKEKATSDTRLSPATTTPLPRKGGRKKTLSGS